MLNRISEKFQEGFIRASFEKVENVVKPPQSPTVRNKAHLSPSLALWLKIPHKRPIRKHQCIASLRWSD